jgi:hypothetical protein
MTGNAMIIDSPENRPLAQYPRNIIKAAVQYMKDSGIADEMKILPEFEFYLFDNVAWNVEGKNISATVDATQSYWNSDKDGLGVIVAVVCYGNGLGMVLDAHLLEPCVAQFACRHFDRYALCLGIGGGVEGCLNKGGVQLMGYALGMVAVAYTLLAT